MVGTGSCSVVFANTAVEAAVAAASASAASSDIERVACKQDVENMRCRGVPGVTTCLGGVVSVAMRAPALQN